MVCEYTGLKFTAFFETKDATMVVEPGEEDESLETIRNACYNCASR